MITNPASFRRRAAGASLILAPLCLLLGMAIDPVPSGITETGPSYALHPTAVGISASLLHYCWVLLVPGVIGLIHLVRGRGVVLAHIGGVLGVLGLIDFSSLTLVDFFESSAYQRLPAAQAAAIIDGAAQPAMIAGWQLPGMIGTLFGLILITISVVRAGRAGWWLPAGTVLGLVVFVIGGTTWTLLLGLAGPAILLVTLGAMGVSLMRMSDREWSAGAVAA